MEVEVLNKLHNCQMELLNEFVRICNENKLEYFLYGGTLLGAVRHKGFIPWDDDLDLAMPREDYERFLKIAPSNINSKFMIDNYHTNKKCYLNFTKIRNKNTLFIQDFQIGYDGPKGIWIDVFPLDGINKITKFQILRIKIIKSIRSIAHYKSNIFWGNNKIKLKKFLSMFFKVIPLNSLLAFQDKIMKGNSKKKYNYFINIASQYSYKKQTMPKKVFLPAKELMFEGRKYKVPNDYDYFLKRIYGNYMELPPKEKRITHNPVDIQFEGDIKNDEKNYSIKD